jgi:cell division protease FtsH
VFLGHSVARTQNVSPETMITIDAEVRRLVKTGEDEARRILTEQLEGLHAVAKALLEFETLSGDEIIGVMKGVQPVRVEDDLIKPTGPVASVPVSPTNATA